jgi:cell division protein FtsB
MNPFEFALGIILITAAVSIVRLLANRQDRREPDAEAERLKDEVEMLRDRIAVLERITVERENSLERQIESLRDR